jgi:fucose 4-O-acetylase-like acetyltransferase
MAERKKDLSVETLRGIAIILVVIGHVIGYDSQGGMKVPEDSFLRHFYFTFQYLRMPLFTAISGWVYALMPVNRQYLSGFTVKKVRRIILPLIFVGGLYYIVQGLTPNTNFSYPIADIWRILIFPYTFYWYLYALFLVFLVIAVIDVYKLADKVSSWLIILVLSIGLLIVRDTIFPHTVPNIFGFKNAIYLFPFFLIGLGIKRFKSLFDSKYLIYATGAALIAGLVFQQLVWYKVINYEFSQSSGLGLVIGVLGVITLLHLNFRNIQLAWIGNFAYTIFLFHSFGTSGGRIILKAFGIHSTPVIFFVSLLMGLFLPILAENILDKTGVTRMLFLGRSYNKKGDKD